MVTLYLECNMGAAGDMLTAALLELTENPSDFIMKFNSAGIPRVLMTAEKSVKCGIVGTHVHILVDGHEENEDMHEHHHHHHRTMADTEQIILNLNVSDAVKNNAICVYRIIAEAEAKAHGQEISEIHFHEVGTMDAIADVVAVCMLMEELKADKIIASPVHVGSGTVKCAHGILPVPAPATAHILNGIPIYSGNITGELCTPTGAALLKHFASEFGAMPEMKIKNIGYGMGSKDFETANCVRAFLGQSTSKNDSIIELRCNVDDMTGEEIGFATQILMENGALDVFTINVGMKKNRPGILITCICKENDKNKMLELIFIHTTTLGIREYTPNRHVLERREIVLKTNYGDVRGKRSAGYGTERVKAEYEDLAQIAKKEGISIKDIKISEE